MAQERGNNAGVKAELRRVSDDLVKVALDELGVVSPNTERIESAFRAMVKVERDLWRLKAEISGKFRDSEVDYRLMSLLSSSRPSHRNLPYILAGLRTLAQLPEDDLLRSNQDRNVLLERLREGMRFVADEIRSIESLLP